MKYVRKAALAASALACAALFSFSWSDQGAISLSVDSAQARVGHPLTPVSAAGVARRQTRRAVYGAGYGVGAAGAAAIGTAGALAAAPFAAAAYDAYAAAPYAASAALTPAPFYGAGAPYDIDGYGFPVVYYSGRNGFICQPGSLVELNDGMLHRCQ